jgi:putative phosphoribosyl transferase
MPTTAIQRGVCVEAAGARLAGWLYLPPTPRGFVVFASSRNLMRLDRRQVDLSEALNLQGLGTLLFDLVETTDGPRVERDVETLAARLIGATGWSRRQWGVNGLPLGYLGSGLGSAAALSAAASFIPKIRAVALQGGRPDLAGEKLFEVKAPTLLLADSDDSVEVEAARRAASYLSGPHRVHRVRCDDEHLGTWRMTPALTRWLAWNLGSREILR